MLQSRNSWIYNSTSESVSTHFSENVVASNTGVALKQKLPPDRMRRICRGEKLLMKGKPDEMNSTHIKVYRVMEL